MSTVRLQPLGVERRIRSSLVVMPYGQRTAPRLALRTRAFALTILLLPGCVTSHLVASVTQRTTPLVEGGDAVGGLAIIGALAGGALIVDIVTFPIQYSLGFYPYGHRYQPTLGGDGADTKPVTGAGGADRR